MILYPRILSQLLVIDVEMKYYYISEFITKDRIIKMINVYGR